MNYQIYFTLISQIIQEGSRILWFSENKKFTYIDWDEKGDDNNGN